MREEVCFMCSRKCLTVNKYRRADCFGKTPPRHEIGESTDPCLVGSFANCTVAVDLECSAQVLTRGMLLNQV